VESSRLKSRYLWLYYLGLLSYLPTLVYLSRIWLRRRMGNTSPARPLSHLTGRPITNRRRRGARLLHSLPPFGSIAG
jgi:hypothetical protein